MPGTGHDDQGGRGFAGGTGWWRARPERERMAWVGLLLFVAVFAVYGRTTGFAFTNFDDPAYVTENPPVARGLSGAGVLWAFTTGHTGMWHPVTWLSHMLDAGLFGMNPAGHHLVNVLLHYLNVVLLFAFLRGATHQTGRSLVVAVFFALHPLNVEVVAWVSQRKSVLSALFFMLTLLAWLGHVRGRRGAAPLAWIFFALGLMAKPMLVTLPAVLLLLDVWPFRRTALGWPRLVREKLPFFLLMAAALFMLLCPPVDVDTLPTPRVPSLHTLQLGLANYLHYLTHLVWPAPLGVLYPEPEHVAWLAWSGGLAVLLAASGWVVLRHRERPDLLVGWLWFAGMLLPVAGFVPIGGPQGSADRYAYLPAIGLFIALAWARPWKPPVGAAVAAGLALTWAVVAFFQVGYWRNSLALWSHTAAITRTNRTLLLNHGAALVAAGRYDQAEACFQQLEALYPAESRASLNLAVIYERQGRLAQAVSAAERSVRLEPGDYRARSNYASLLMSAGHREEAVEQLRIAINQHPDFADSWINLGVARVEQGRLADAAGCFERALAIRPDSAAARRNLALVREQLRQNAAAPPVPRS